MRAAFGSSDSQEEERLIPTNEILRLLDLRWFRQAVTKITELFDWFIFYTLDKTNNQLWLFITVVIIIDDLYLSTLL